VRGHPVTENFSKAAFATSKVEGGSGREDRAHEPLARGGVLLG